MFRLATALALIVAPALAEDRVVDPAVLQKCPPIGQSVKGELIYGMDCPALRAENRVEVLPNMPATNMKDTVIPRSGGAEKADTAPLKGDNR
jgi:hypothetical protein